MEDLLRVVAEQMGLTGAELCFCARIGELRVTRDKDLMTVMHFPKAKVRDEQCREVNWPVSRRLFLVGGAGSKFLLVEVDHHGHDTCPEPPPLWVLTPLKQVR